MLHSLNNAIAYEILLGVLMVRSERADLIATLIIKKINNENPRQEIVGSYTFL